MVKNHYVRERLLMNEFIWFEGKNGVMLFNLFSYTECQN